jgi:hypothetical protein
MNKSGGSYWTDKEIKQLTEEWNKRTGGVSIAKFSKQYAKHSVHTMEAIRYKLSALRDPNEIHESPYPVYDEPLETVGDALILTDVEFPFHNADFLNRCLRLAKAWKVRNLIAGGDLVHFDSLSGWEPSWTEVKLGGLSDSQADMLFEFVNHLNRRDRKQGETILESIGKAEAHDGVSTELAASRTEIKRLEKQFDHIDFVLGNHEGRLLRALETALSPSELMRLLEIKEGKWRVSSYYYSVLVSNGERFQIEHPKNTAKFSAWKLASKYCSHVIMGHSHQLNFTFDISGKYYAIETGHIVDEDRLAYAAQRHNTNYAHVLGACIVKDGCPYLLHARTNFEVMERMFA